MADTRTRDISVQRDGLALHGRIDQPNTDEVTPVVLVMHGFMRDLGYTDDDVLARVTAQLVEQGNTVVRFDFNGRGKSEGSFDNSDLFNQLEDAIAVFEYIRREFPESQLAVLGHSQGGVIAGMLAGMYHDCINALVMLAPAASIKNDALRGELLGVPFDPVHIPEHITLKDGEHSVDGKFVRIASMMPIFETTALFKQPALLIMGRDDQIVNDFVPNNYSDAMRNCAVSYYDHLGHPFTGEDSALAITEAVQFLSTAVLNH